MSAQRQSVWRLDYAMLAAVLAICIGGLLAIKGAEHNDPHAADYIRKQVAGVVVGFGVLLLLATHDYERIFARLVRPMYGWNLVILLVLAVPSHISHASHGASRWIGFGPIQIQPSEFAKLILICTLSFYLVARIQTIHEWPTVFKSILHIGAPMLLIMKQPDLGTALVLAAIWFGMMTVAGARPMHLAVLVLAGSLLFGGMWHFHVLKDYQKNRLEVFLNPDADPRDAGYHLRQSEIAIGSGGLEGKGYGKGSQSNGRFIPEQHTDFIFTVIGEEGGFISCVVLLMLYYFILMRGVVAMADCEEPHGRLLAAGVLSMLTFHTVVNAGMTMGIMPVVGVPLPFFSYGLSSLLVNMASIGLLQSVIARKHRLMFTK